jgi:hypothetical protein
MERLVIAIVVLPVGAERKRQTSAFDSRQRDSLHEVESRLSPALRENSADVGVDAARIAGRIVSPCEAGQRDAWKLQRQTCGAEVYSPSQ